MVVCNKCIVVALAGLSLAWQVSGSPLGNVTIRSYDLASDISTGTSSHDYPVVSISDCIEDGETNLPTTIDTAGHKTTPISPCLNPKIKIHPRNPIRKRMLSWDCLNSANPALISQIDFRLIPSYHNWHGWRPADAPKIPVPQRLIIHDESELSGFTWTQILSSPSSNSIVGFFNEPERTPGMTPSRAADLWMAKMVPLRKNLGKQLMSPGCANSPEGVAWCDAFIEIVSKRGGKPDFQGVHFYAQGVEAANQAVGFLRGRRARWPGMDVFVLEIASLGRGRREVFSFTGEVSNWMDRTPWIREYAWFGFMPGLADGFISPAAQLMLPGGGLSELGKKLLTEQPMKY